MANTLDKTQNGKDWRWTPPSVDAMRAAYTGSTTAQAKTPVNPNGAVFDETSLGNAVAKPVTEKPVPHNYKFDETSIASKAVNNSPTPPAAQNPVPSAPATTESAIAARAAQTSSAPVASQPSMYDQVRQMYEELYGQLPENRDYTKEISDLYDKAYASRLAQLQSGYDEVQRALAAAGERIPRAYQEQSNALAAEYERQRANMNERLAASGINSGAGAQAALAQSTGYLNSAGQIRQAQADAQADLEREIASQEAQYQNAIAQALADNDYQRAVALTQEMKDYQSRAMQIAQMGLGIGQNRISAQTQALSADQQTALDRAKTLASYGDFSGYASLYGQDAANNMRDVWLAQNPQFAYMTGNMSADDYYRLTGQYAPGTQPRYTYTPPAADNGDTETEIVRDIPTYDEEPTEPVTTTGMDARSFGRMMSSIGTARNATEASTAFNAAVAPNWDGMSESQKANVRSVMRGFGYNING